MYCIYPLHTHIKKKIPELKRKCPHNASFYLQLPSTSLTEANELSSLLLDYCLGGGDTGFHIKNETSSEVFEILLC